MYTVNVLHFAIFLAVLTTGNGLRCYNCNGGGDSACADPIKASILEANNALKTCDAGHVCIKYKSEHVQRGCSPPTTPQGTEICANSDFVLCSTCNTELCNSSEKIKPFFVILPTIVVIVAGYLVQ